MSILNLDNLDKNSALILWFNQTGIHDLALTGGKNASLAEMVNKLASKGVNVPDGFAVTTTAYRYFIAKANLEPKLQEIFADLDVDDLENLRQHGEKARALMLETPFPKELEQAISNAYIQLSKSYTYKGSKVDNEETDVAVRSSATAEDLPDASFAGQQETYLAVRGVTAVIDSCHKCFASIFTDRAISYRAAAGFNHLDVYLSVGVQKMVRSDLAASGVMFTVHPETGNTNVASICAAYGLGENVVQGAVNPDEILVFKPGLVNGNCPIVSKQLGDKAIQMVYDLESSKLTKNIPVNQSDRSKFAINDDEILTLARWAVIIENHYSSVRGVYTPMDIEWAKDGQTGQLFIVQARPETVQSQKSVNILTTYQLTCDDSKPKPLATGNATGERIGQGHARVIFDISQIDEFQEGEVLVTNKTDPDWEPIMKKAGAIVTNQGGRTCHAAIIAREKGIPAIVGCGNATSSITTGQEITVSCSEGTVGNVYNGLLPFEVIETDIGDLPKTRTQILMNVGNPDEALGLAAIPGDGVGLARLEFVIANQIKIHPLALLHFDEVKDRVVKQQIAALTMGYKNKADYFVDILTQGIATLGAAFFPRPAIARMSDFKSNEYANLLGGRQFEPNEENPMIGWRGASRYYDPTYRAAFALECQAIKRVREMGLTNIIPMIPFCRTPDEGRRVIAEMATNGLVQGANGLEVYMMCEVPSNVILAAEFAQIFDGFSIGSNDLTQLTLGLDRDSELVSHIFDERNPAVMSMIQMAIRTFKANGKKVGICGQAPSDYPEFARFLVEEGIDSISLNPDSVIKTRLEIARVEAELSIIS